MDRLNNFVMMACALISALGALIVMWGVVEAAKGFIQLKLSREKKASLFESGVIRQRLGAHLLLGLEVFIAGDIISSVVSPSWEKIGMLAAIVGIRTVLSYFLRTEVGKA
ncbi:MAG: DUF1622 domain-containing protein [Candidatus Omnitrophica bacterium]|nr:DUF1622 domain-containing protein [Candidatus Omnitrophota bacterium]